MDESSYSSFYSSFLKTDSSSGRDENNEKNQQKFSIDDMQWEKMPSPKRRWRRPDPPWLDNINITPELVYRYQMTAKTIGDVLKADTVALKKINQVNTF